jgi:hypothetical protein
MTTSDDRDGGGLSAEETDALWAAIERAFLDTSTFSRASEDELETTVARIVAARVAHAGWHRGDDGSEWSVGHHAAPNQYDDGSWVPAHVEQARHDAEVAARALRAFGNRMATPIYPGLDAPTLHEVWKEAMAEADSLVPDAADTNARTPACVTCGGTGMVPEPDDPDHPEAGVHPVHCPDCPLSAPPAALCRCGCPEYAHIGEIGCSCGLPDEPPCAADTTDGGGADE